MIFQAAFRPWEGGSRHQLLGSFPLPHGYPPAPIARRTTDERRFLVSLSSISLAGAGRPYQGRPVLRPGDITDVFVFKLSKINCASAQREPRGAQILVSWIEARRCYRLSYQPVLWSGHEKPDALRHRVVVDSMQD